MQCHFNFSSNTIRASQLHESSRSQGNKFCNEKWVPTVALVLNGTAVQNEVMLVKMLSKYHKWFQFLPSVFLKKHVQCRACSLSTQEQETASV